MSEIESESIKIGAKLQIWKQQTLLRRRLTRHVVGNHEVCKPCCDWTAPLFKCTPIGPIQISYGRNRSLRRKLPRCFASFALGNFRRFSTTSVSFRLFPPLLTLSLVFFKCQPAEKDTNVFFCFFFTLSNSVHLLKSTFIFTLLTEINNNHFFVYIYIFFSGF